MLPILALSAMGIIFVMSCSKDAHSWSRSTASPTPSTCDTCAGSSIATGKTVIVYPQGSDWADRSNGRFECDLEPLLKNMVSPIDSYYINYFYIGRWGRDAKRLKSGIAISYDNGSLTWFGYKLNFQALNGQSPPESMALKLLMTHL